MLRTLLYLALIAGLSACGTAHTGGFFGAGNGGAAGGVTQSFRW